MTGAPAVRTEQMPDPDWQAIARNLAQCIDCIEPGLGAQAFQRVTAAHGFPTSANGIEFLSRFLRLAGWMPPVLANTLRAENARILADNEHLRREKAQIWDQINAVAEAAKQLQRTTE